MIVNNNPHQPNILTVYLFPPCNNIYCTIFILPLCRSFIHRSNDTKRLCCPLENHCAVPCNPVYIITNKLKSFFLDLVVDDAHVFSEFTEFDNSPLQVDQSSLVEVTRDNKTLLDKAVHCLKEKACSFVM